jgi:hypothetical protein
MTFEAALITAIGAVTGALVFVCKLLWARSERCETDRIALRLRVESLEGLHGQARGELLGYKRCPLEDCPFRDDS